MFVRPVLGMDAGTWVAANVAGLTFLGGVPRRLVIDNLRTGVDRPDLYDPKINRAYAEMAAHYGCLVDPARRGKPKDKPRVERPMPYVGDSFWRGRRWTDEADMHTAAVGWCTQVAGRRPHRWLEGLPAGAVCGRRGARIGALPPEPFELARWSAPKVGPDCHVKVGKALYSVPWRLIGRQVDAREAQRTVEVFVDGTAVKTWSRVQRGKQTDWADYPPEKVAFFMRTPWWCRRRAGELGPGVAELVAGLLSGGALHHLRAAQGVVGLADKHTSQRLDAACRLAIEVGDPGYRTVKGILVAGTERNGQPDPTVPSAPAHLHGRPPCSTASTAARTGGGGMTRRHQLETSLRTPWAVGDARHPGRPPGPGARRRARAPRVPPGAMPGRGRPPRGRAVGRRVRAAPSNRPPPSKTSTSPTPPRSRRHRSATWPACASWRPASRSSCTARSAWARR